MAKQHACQEIVLHLFAIKIELLNINKKNGLWYPFGKLLRTLEMSMNVSVRKQI